MIRLVMLGYSGSVHTRRWATFLAERGHDVHVVTCGRGAQERTVAAEPPFAVHDLGPPWAGRAGYLAKIAGARMLIRRLRPDLVHAQFATSYGMLAVAAGRHPLVVTTHGDDILIAPRNALIRPIIRRVLCDADLVTVPAEHMRREVGRLTRERARAVEVFQYGVETARLAETRVRRNTADELRLVTLRPLLELYRTDAIIRGVARLAERGMPVRFDVAGEGPERPRLERLAVELGVQDAVKFHGQLPERDAEALLASADLYVSAAASDGASLALLEAMALGVVPVVSDIPANREWITDGVNGVVVGEQPAAIAEGVLRACALDAGDVARRNRGLVGARADRARNLGRFESLVLSLVRDPAAGR